MINDHAESTTVKQFIDADIENLRGAENNLARVDPLSMDTIELGARVLHDLSTVFGAATKLRDKTVHFAAWAKQNRLSAEDAASFLIQSTFIGENADDAAQRARLEVEQSLGVLVRSILLLRIRRDFYYGVTDVMKNRVNWGFATLRVQAETLALIRLIRDKPGVAVQWLNADTGAKGKAFHRRYHPKLVDLIRNWDLGQYYDLASASALHSRIGGVASPVTASGALNIVSSGIEVSMLTVDTLNSGEWYLSLCYYLRFYDRALSRIGMILPEVADDEGISTLAKDYSQSVSRRWNALCKCYPAIAEKARTGVHAIG